MQDHVILFLLQGNIGEIAESCRTWGQLVCSSLAPAQCPGMHLLRCNAQLTGYQSSPVFTSASWLLSSLGNSLKLPKFPLNLNMVFFPFLPFGTCKQLLCALKQLMFHARRGCISRPSKKCSFRSLFLTLRKCRYVHGRVVQPGTFLRSPRVHFEANEMQERNAELASCLVLLADKPQQHFQDKSFRLMKAALRSSSYFQLGIASPRRDSPPQPLPNLL